MEFTIITTIFNQRIEQSPVSKLLLAKPYYQFIFTDNSTDKQIQKDNQSFTRTIANATYFSRGENLGSAKAYNSVLSLIRNEWVIFLDQDTGIDLNYFLILEKNIVSQPSFFIFAPLMIDHDKIMSPLVFKNYRYSQFDPKKKRKNKPNEMVLPIDSCACVNTLIFKRGIRFDERLFLDCVDYAFFRRCFRAGFPTFVMTDCLIPQNFSGTDFSCPKQKALFRFRIFVKDSCFFYCESRKGARAYKRTVLRRALHLSLIYHDLLFVRIGFGAIRKNTALGKGLSS
jgi:GT2 family glycosyltransferase